MAFVAAALPVLGAVGAVAGAAGTIMGGVAAQNSANYRAAVAHNNELVAEQNAVRAEQAGGAEAENQSRKSAAQLGQLVAGQAASGVNVDSGSNVDVQVGQRETGKLDTETVLQNADLKAYGYRVNAENYGAESALDQSTANQAVPGAVLSATGSLLGKASSLGGKYNSNAWTGGGDSGAVYPSDDI